MAPVFHLFSALPTELRLQIWKDAVRPDLPAAHILRVRVPGSDVSDRPQDTIRFSRRRYQYRSHPQSDDGMAIPLWNKYVEDINNGSDSNISSYLIDAGSWTACHESRLMMQKQFSSAGYRSIPSWKGYCISGGAPLYITIRCSEDLVILQLDSLDFEDWDAETDGRLDDLWNIGIEIIDASEDDAFYKIYMFGEIVDRTRVWIIDHNLRRKTDAPPCDEKRGREFMSCENVSFYAADRKFSSTGLEKGGERLAHWEYINPVADGEHRKSSLYFADRLHDCYEARLDLTARGSGTILGLLGWDRL
ncbi:hypothetical protein FMUND_6207 [Fusarium mundagurra]|uniref:2EXR domain-containing protein n=1 Tax=Fusarium mundagurra TaxID=1567541 RepID=A0A8H5YSW6_9HYPO|nr:hypothetical protein FMUND_6207 [Fusarium mundagurra]